ncbi:MAG: glycosyltransferase family 2 protein [Pseudomonadota bacterium]
MTHSPSPDATQPDASADLLPDVTVVSCVTDVAPYLLEWVAWHALVGVSRFVVYSYACTDGTDRMLDRIAELGPLEHHRLDALSEGKQPLRAAVNAAAELPAVSDAEWAIALGPDEFLEINVGQGRLADLLKACAETAPLDAEGTRATVDAIALPWRIMGSSRRIDYDPAPVTSRFCRGARLDRTDTEEIVGFRSLYRPASFTRPGPSRPWIALGQADKGPSEGPPPIWLNGSGADISRSMNNQPRRAQNALPEGASGAKLASVRRYAVKSRVEFLHAQLGDTPPAEGARTPLGWDAWTLRDINAAALPPLGPGPLCAAIADLERDPLLAACQAEARAALTSGVDALVAAQPAARHFRETGETWEPDTPMPPARLLCVGTHPRVGTLWLRRTLDEAGSALGVPVIRMDRAADLEKLPETGPAILVNWRSRLPRALFARNDARMLHITRDPRDMLLSAVTFHRKVIERFDKGVHEPRPEFSGLSYQAMLNALPDDVTRLRFEMDHRHATTMDDMMAWACGRVRSIELAYEDLIQDPQCQHFGAALAEADVQGIDVNTVLSAFWKHALFGGLAESRKVEPRLQVHVTSAQPGRWRTELPREVAEDYAQRFGEALRVLGYAQDDTWVSECRPAAALGLR